MFRLTSINVKSAAKISGVLYGSMALLFIPFFLVVAFVAPKADNAPPAIFFVIFAIVAPFLYAGLGALMGAAAAWVYNLAAGFVGGIEFQFEGASPNTIALLAPKPNPQQ